jgi:hypothetical protein
MTRRARALDRPWDSGLPRAARPGVWLLAALLGGLAGCMDEVKTRLQADDAERDRYADVKTVGDVTVVGNAAPVPLGGVGLVTGLEGTGGESPPDGYRAMLEEQLRKDDGVRNVKELLTSPNNALVIVEGLLLPGARKGDPVDVEVTIPPGSRATSLRGGYLQKCWLKNYDHAQHLNPNYTGPVGWLPGHKIVVAEGPILVGLGQADGDESATLKQGRIWGGGKTRVDQPLGLMLNPDQQFARVSALVADRVNQTFHGGLNGSFTNNVALAKNNLAVVLQVPSQYRLNIPRYLRVVRLVPLADIADVPPAEGPDRRTYRQRVAADLLDPARTVVAALRLEALGEKSIPVLKKGLAARHPLVRFCSAEALAYLGSPAAAEELGKAVEEPLFRAFALTALASFDEAASQNKLQEILLTSGNDETRVGAFRALRALNERNDLVRGQFLNDSFWLHRVAPGAEPLVHVSTTKRAEIVLFGEEPRLLPEFSLLAGEFTLTATADEPRCTISRVPLRGAPLRKQCSLALADVLRTMADMGAQYPDVLALLQQADSCKRLSCRVRCDALPQAGSVYDLVRLGTGELKGELVPAGQTLGDTPTLYENSVPSQLFRQDGPAPRPGAAPAGGP